MQEKDPSDMLPLTLSLLAFLSMSKMPTWSVQLLISQSVAARASSSSRQGGTHFDHFSKMV